MELTSRIVEKWNKLADTKERIKLFYTPEMQAIIKIESSALKGLRRYFEEHGFVEIVVPHITKATGACENIATMFDIDYFGRHAYLTQTGQLYLEVLSQFLEKVWCTIHSFRAEPDVDNRHLTEFTLVEMEIDLSLIVLAIVLSSAVAVLKSLALTSTTSRLKSLAIACTIAVFPHPGGP